MTKKGRMFDVEAIRRASAVNPHVRECSFKPVLVGMGEEDRRDFDALMADRNVRSSVLFPVLRDLGYKGSVSTIRRHRTEGCSVCGVKGDKGELG